MTTPITYRPSLFSLVDASQLLKALWNELDWLRHPGVPRREYHRNRLNKAYSYGVADFARLYEPQPDHPAISQIWSVVEEAAGCKFEVCFLNGYEDQSDSLGWHSDNSPEMDDDRPIAIVSLGVEREIWFREIPKPRITRDVVPDVGLLKLKLEHGSLCLMHPGMQDTHQHRIPKAPFMCGERVSLTFRGYTEET